MRRCVNQIRNANCDSCCWLEKLTDWAEAEVEVGFRLGLANWSLTEARSDTATSEADRWNATIDDGRTWRQDILICSVNDRR